MSLIIISLGIIFFLISIYLFFFKSTSGGACQVSSWSDWGDCNNQKQTRTRTIKQPGTGCPPLSDTQDCEKDCVYGQWGDCSKTCGSGIQTRSVTSGDTQKCTDLQQVCNTQDCKPDCQVSSWSDWGSCTQPCGTGEQTRTRTVSGTNCPAQTDTQPCNTQPCNRYGTLCANCADPINGCTFTEIFYNKKNCNPTTGTCKNVLGADQLGCLPTGMDMNDICQKQYGNTSKAVWNGKSWSCTGSDPSMDINAYCVKKFSNDVADPKKQVLGVKKPCFDITCGGNFQWLKSDGSTSDIEKFESDNFEWDCLYPGTKPCLDDCCSGKPECNGSGKLN